MAKRPTKKKTTKKSSKSTTRSSASQKSGKTASKKTTKKSTKATKSTRSTKKVAGKSSTAATRTQTSKSSKKASVAKGSGTKASKANASKTGTSRPRKSHLDRKQLKHFRELLLEKRLELIGDLVGMEDSALRGQDRSNLSTMPLHMADVGSDNYDQELTLGLMESERKMLREIDEALDRIENGTFGICVATNKPINKARLEAKPWAKYCIEAAREMERNGNGG